MIFVEAADDGSDGVSKSMHPLESDSDDEQAALSGAGDSESERTSAWRRNSFINPLQLLSHLSGYPNLHMLYSIFCCLPVSSASAERALSKLKIIKNRLRTSLSDDTLSALLLLASEKDIIMDINNDTIINRIAFTNPKLKSELLF